MPSSREHDIQLYLELLDDPDPSLRIHALNNLAAIGDAAILTRFLEMLEDPSLANQPFKYSIYIAIIFNLPYLLEDFPNQKAEDKIIEILADDTETSEVYRATCADALGLLKTEKSLSALIDLLPKTPPRVQESIVFQLGERGDKRALPKLEKLISHQNTQTADPEVIQYAKEAVHAITMGHRMRLLDETDES